MHSPLLLAAFDICIFTIHRIKLVIQYITCDFLIGVIKKSY